MIATSKPNSSPPVAAVAARNRTYRMLVSVGAVAKGGLTASALLAPDFHAARIPVIAAQVRRARRSVEFQGRALILHDRVAGGDARQRPSRMSEERVRHIGVYVG